MTSKAELNRTFKLKMIMITLGGYLYEIPSRKLHCAPAKETLYLFLILNPAPFGSKNNSQEEDF